MKKLLWLNISMVFVLLFAVLATSGTALAGEPPPPPPPGGTFFIKKDVFASMKSGWEWSIEKMADVDHLLLEPGEVGQINYTVRLVATPVTAQWNIRGNVIVRNRTENPIYVEAINDQLDDGTPITLDCDTVLPTTLAAGGRIVCRYNQDLDNGNATSNTATVIYGEGDEMSTTVAINWGAPAEEVDECVDVFDNNLPGGLGVVCAGESPKTFEYMIEVGPFEECSLHEINNTAFFMGQDTGATGQASEVVTVEVPCDEEEGCTLTPGYWKTHSMYGPAPYDDTWAEIGEDTAFFLSGKTYYQALWTSTGGNPYYILAHAYIAAELNQLNGADFTDAQAAFTAATALFEAFTPAQAAQLRGDERAMWIELAMILDNYNNGYIGPGHCEL